jgi:hypothetical protein
MHDGDHGTEQSKPAPIASHDAGAVTTYRIAQLLLAHFDLIG